MGSEMCIRDRSSPEAISPIQDEIDASKPAKLEISLKLRDSTRVLSDVSVDVQWYEEGVPSKTSARSNASGVIALEFEHGAQFAGVIAHPSPYAAKGSLETSVLLLGGTTHEFDLVLNPAAAVMGTVYDVEGCLLYTSPSPRDLSTSRMPSSA